MALKLRFEKLNIEEDWKKKETNAWDDD